MAETLGFGRIVGYLGFQNKELTILVTFQLSCQNKLQTSSIQKIKLGICSR
ncbi:hypothetical protein COLO4_06404 [Corchorus olitorius]|uniref:Uncharacterized protein n=1 Tax=Corchorus olitorius TaxID=93759 RepID=A0A1R3KN28_9ROSI|nr:hypothetical protein COLO4_06404 [Corchorus olitorius]